MDKKRKKYITIFNESHLLIVSISDPIRNVLLQPSKSCEEKHKTKPASDGQK